MATSWEKIAETATEQELHDSYKFELYQQLTDPPGSVVTLTQKSDYKLRRGKRSSKSKFNYITHTSIDLSIIDYDFWLIDKLRSDDEFNFKGVILKNASTFFAGYVTLQLKDLLYKKTNEVVRLTIYDGMKRLQDFDDLTDLGTGLTQMKEILRTLFNKLNLELDINAYQNIYTGFDDTISDEHQLHLTYIKIEDYINTLGKRTNFYNFLIVLCKTFDWNIFQENGVWVIRQNASMRKGPTPGGGVWKEVVIYTNGAYSVSKVDMDRAIANTDLLEDPITFEMDKIDKVEISVTPFRADETPQTDEGDVEDWLNPFFIEGSRGWTTVSGTPDYRDDAVYLDPTEEIKQEFLGLVANDTIIIKLSATAIRMLLDSGDVLASGWNNPFFKIKYIDNNSLVWYISNFTLNSWISTSADNQILIGLAMAGMPEAGMYKKIYNRQTFELDLEIAIPALAVAPGILTIFCYGGGAASGNNHPFEQGSIIHFASVERKTDASDFPISVPTKSVLRSEVSNAKEVHSFEIPLADYNPYNGVTFWHLEKTVSVTDYARSYNWSPDGGLLIQNIADRIIKQNRNKKGYNIKLIPGTTLNFIDLAKMDLETEGADSYYLPVFEEAILIRDHRRFILLKHNYDSPTITTKKEFIFPNTLQQ